MTPASTLSRAVSASLVAASLAACAGRLPTPVRPTVPAPGDEMPGARAATPTASALSDADVAYLRGRALLVPVANVRTQRLTSTFDAPRDGGERVHQALDILAPRGTPVLAADDGHVWTVRSNNLGGLTVYTVDPAERFVFYYAHLDRYRDGLADGMPLLKGDTLGFVGTTGNAPPDTPHLHFQVARIGADHHWWTGTPVDPLPFLRDAEVALAGRGGLAGAVTPASRDRRESIVVPAIRTRRPTVPADTTLPDSTRHRPPR